MVAGDGQTARLPLRVVVGAARQRGSPGGLLHGLLAQPRQHRHRGTVVQVSALTLRPAVGGTRSR